MLGRGSDHRGDFEIINIDMVVPKNHLLRKIDRVVDFSHIYGMTRKYYCEELGRPAVDPVVLVKMAFLQHIYGIKSLRQTVKEVDMNMAYRWFLGFNFLVEVPHFSTLSYAFSNRFQGELFEEIFAWILSEIAEKKLLSTDIVFIDSTHVKANANRNKRYKELSTQTAHIYTERLMEEINAERIKDGKQPYDEPPAPAAVKEITLSRTDPESGMFVKDEHRSEFAYSAHVACDRNNFILESVVTPGNVHDSRVFDEVYDSVTEAHPEIETVTVDAAYRTPWICKKVEEDGRNISTAYKRPGGKKGYSRPSEYMYNRHTNHVLCPEKQVLEYKGVTRDGYRTFTGKKELCSVCTNKIKCTVQKVKTVFKHIWSEYVELAEDYRRSPEGKASYGLRSQTIERVFADAKEKHGMRYTLLRGLKRVSNWIKLKFAAMNLKKLAMMTG